MLVNFFTKVFLLLIGKSQFFIRKIVLCKCELLGTVLSVGHQQAFDDRNYFFRRDEFDSGKRSGGFVLCHHLTVTEDGRREHKKKGSQRGWRPSDHQEREEKSREGERERVRERERERERGASEDKMVESPARTLKRQVSFSLRRVREWERERERGHHKKKRRRKWIFPSAKSSRVRRSTICSGGTTMPRRRIDIGVGIGATSRRATFDDWRSGIFARKNCKRRISWQPVDERPESVRDACERELVRERVRKCERDSEKVRESVSTRTRAVTGCLRIFFPLSLSLSIGSSQNCKTNRQFRQNLFFPPLTVISKVYFRWFLNMYIYVVRERERVAYTYAYI